EGRLRKAEADRVAAEARAAEQRNRRKVQLALAAAVGLLLAGGGAFAWWQDKQAAGRRAFESERRLKADQTRTGVRANLDQAAALRKQYRFREAGELLGTARRLAHSDAPDLLPEVER